MWIRVAYWIGTVKPGLEDAFRETIDDEMVPAIRRMPDVHDARALWPQRPEEGAPALVCQMLVEFDDRESIDRMLASPERQALRATAGVKVAAMFDGTLSHIDCAVG